MKRQTLQIGGALLATTALSTSAYAAIISEDNNTTTSNTTFTAKTLSTTVFGGTTPSNTILAAPVGVGYNIDFANQLTTSFDVDLTVSGAKFSTTAGAVTLLAFTESTATGGTLAAASFVNGTNCTVQVLLERILVDNCLSTFNNNACRIDVIQLSGIRYTQANGLATAGSSISLSGIVTGNTGNQTFELISPATVVTSAAPLATTVTTGGASGVFTINNAASPAFSTLNAPTALTTAGNSTTSAILATVEVTSTGAVGTNLTTALTTATAQGGMNLQISHGVLTDGAVVNLTLSANGPQVQSASGSALAGNTASFTVAPANVGARSFEIEVNFNGTSAIAAYDAGTVAVTFSTSTASVTAPTGVTAGVLASFSRGGFQTQINTAQSTAVADFLSFVRITNNGSVAGTASIQVGNDATGSVYGTFTTTTINPNSTMQISMAQIEAGTSGLTTPAGQYILNISGSISGYAQHVMLNSQNGTFVDLSGFRIGNATTGFP